MSRQTRACLIAVLAFVLLAATGSAASAEVVSNVRVELGPFTTFNNPCDPSDGALTVTVVEHRVTRVQSDGTIVQHINAHGTAVSATGSNYEIIRTLTVVDPPGAGDVATEIFIRRISHGNGDNAQIAITGIGTTVMTTRCVG